jgi:hypothetical protein
MEKLKVLVRIRPFLPNENASNTGLDVDSENSQKIEISKSLKKFSAVYDKVLSQKSTQKDVFNFIKPCMNYIKKGINCTILAYGQTGSGKTYTMFGGEWAMNDKSTDYETRKKFNKDKYNFILNEELTIDPFSQTNGIIPNLIMNLFQVYGTYNPNDNIIITCSYIQIYNEQVYDLLIDELEKKECELIKENLKKIHEKKKKKQLLISLNNIHLNKAKLVEIQEIFSKFTEYKTKSPKFETPKIRNAFNNFNQINFSGRFNRTEEKNIDLEKYKIKKNNIKENPQYVYDYFYEILTNILIAENNYFENLDLSQINLIKNKNYLNPDSRKFFINSLINIQELLNFDERTLFLTTQIFDRYINNVLMKKKIFIKEENLDIVIVTSLIIASKNEEIKLYSMSDYLNILPLKYNIHDLEKTEYEILSGLDFNLNIPSILDFYEIFSIENKLNKFQLAKGLFLLNFILLDSNLVQIPSSLLAYAIIYIVSGKNIQFNKINEEYMNDKEKKVIKILSILKDRQMINNLCGYIRYLYKINKNSHYNAPFYKFNTPNYYFISSYLDI